jgi:hypothetical protein
MVIVAIDKLTNIVKYTSIPSILPENISELDNDELFFKISELEVSILLNSYYNNNEFKQLPEKPSNYHIWNLETEQWEEPENYQQLLFNEAAGKVKQERQRLLATTDWTDTVSASTRLENYNEWQSYRQQLRDITTQEGYPFNVVWPTQPV